MSFSLYIYEKRKKPDQPLAIKDTVLCECKASVVDAKDFLESVFVRGKGGEGGQQIFKKTQYIVSHMKCLECKQYKLLELPKR